MSKYLNFVDTTPEGRKTRIIEVRSKSSGDLLGTIKWFGRWRQYTFFPEPETTFNTDCMASISGAVMGLMAQRSRKEADA